MTDSLYGRGLYVAVGVASSSFPTTGVLPGQRAIDDNDVIYRWTGSAWVQKVELVGAPAPTAMNQAAADALINTAVTGYIATGHTAKTEIYITDAVPPGYFTYNAGTQEFERSGAVDGKTPVNISGYGPNTFSRTIAFNAVTGWEEHHFAAGSNITHISVTAIGDGLVYNFTDTAQVRDSVMALVVLLDVESDTIRDAAPYGATGDLTEATEMSGVYYCPIGQTIEIPLRAALTGGDFGGGRIDVRSHEGSALNALVVAG